ncbi:hypothetical protein [Streptomyces sp. NPDC001388]|uniref:hypothetical protein n=1 Tax=Streptomyces sp. NPDC001388 TaxID=3364568 RepID=UPI0036CFDA16
MNVLVCAACGCRLTEPLRLLSELPPRPGYDGLPHPDGSRHAPPTMPRGTYATRMHDGELMISAGPRGTLVVHPDDTRGRLRRNPASKEPTCRGLPGSEGPNQVCEGCGAVVATQFSECYTRHETHFLPDAVQVAAV